MQVLLMLAYIFWHRPYSHVDRDAYESALMRFQADLADAPPPGMIGAASYRIEPVPWLSDLPGYEDWYLLEASWAMDPLNAFALAGRTQSSHGAVAAQADQGHGGLYAHAGGEVLPSATSTIYWLNRPRGIDWQAALAPVRASCPAAVVWRRQMVLAPATEFAVELPGELVIAPPSGWQQVCRIKRVRLPG
jgi:hypothetical protein